MADCENATYKLSYKITSKPDKMEIIVLTESVLTYCAPPINTASDSDLGLSIGSSDGSINSCSVLSSLSHFIYNLI
jgi:hypothetical protein